MGLTAALVTVPAASASAKGVIEVTVQAEDGTARTLVGESAAADLAVSSRVHSAVFRTDRRILITDPPLGDLGVRFSLLWDLGFGEPIRQDVYPLAEGGPVTFVPAHQPLGGDPSSPTNRTFDGWFRAGDDLGAVLESLGFSLEAGGGGAGLPVRGILLATAAVAIVLIVTATTLSRARRRPVPV